MSSPAAVRILAGMLLLVLPVLAAAADWPMWRYDAGRGAATPHELAAKLHLQWVRELPSPARAWPDQPKMQLDAVYEPVVFGRTVFLGSAREDCVLALDVETGAEKWRFFTDGPVRYAPVAWEGRLYFTSDDGYLYCLDCVKGSLLWKLRGGPSDRKVLGNERLISTWPARGAPVLADGTVYFAAGIWPFMGIFLHAVDARTGKVVWTNDGDSAIYIKQPHNADSFAGVAPQGPLVVSGDTLLVPGGRSVPAVYDRKTGKLLRYQLAENGKRGGGSEVVAAGQVFLNGGAAFELSSEQYLGEFGKSPVANERFLFAVAKDVCRAYELKDGKIASTMTTDRRGNKVKVSKWNVPEAGTCPLPKAECVIQAGTRLVAGARGRVWAVPLPTSQKASGQPVWEVKIEGTPLSLVAAADRLLVSTREGRLYCFGSREGEAPPRRTDNPVRPLSGTDRIVRPTDKGSGADHTGATELLNRAGVRDGYAVVLDAADGKLLAGLTRQSNLRIVALHPDAARVESLRRELSAAGLYGERVAVHVGEAGNFPLPPYLASVIFAPNGPVPAEHFARVYQALRPFGGMALMNVEAGKAEATLKHLDLLKLSQAQGRTLGDAVRVVREGPLPGSANWTHEHADAANTRVSRDTLVRAPLGLLWFGGVSHDDILPRHGHGPQPQVIDGRLLIEGMDVLRAVDVYTGRLLWQTRIPGVGRLYNNLAHQPGANITGTNYISASDAIYVVQSNRCLKLDPATGKTLGQLTLPILPGKKDPPLWGYINVVGDWLLGGSDPQIDPKLFTPLLAGGDDPAPGATPPKKDEAESLLSKLRLPRMDNDNLSSSRHLVLMDRHTGKVRWTVSARLTFRHNAICVGGGRVYAIDRHSGPELTRMKRRGEEPKFKPRLVVFDLETGKEIWHTEDDVFGTWLSYSEKHDILVESGRNARDTLLDEPKGMRAYQGGAGKVLWHQPAYVGPAMIHGDLVLKDRSACDLRTGEPTPRRDPLTGNELEWSWVRNYGCNTPMASEHLLTFRSGAAGFFDLANDGGTGNLGGFRSGCTNNLLVAGGVLVAPDYTRTCTCSYQNQTSLALVHLPEAELWTFFGSRDVKGPVRRVGINFGAPGNRKADDGTLWLEYPRAGGPSPSVPVKVTPADPEWFRRHASQMSGAGHPWVTAGGGKGIQSVSVTLDPKATETRAYTVRLFFAEPELVSAGQRVFHVALQGQEALRDFDIRKEAGGPLRGVVKEFKGVKVTSELTLELTPAAKLPAILCGIEIVAE